MKKLSIAALLLVAFFAVFVTPPAFADDDDERELEAKLSGFQEVPAISTNGSGKFKGKINEAGTSISYELSYSNLQGVAFASHIHLGQARVSGGVIAFLCGGGGKPPCPASGTVSGTIVAADVIGPAGQGIALGEFAELLRAIRAGVTYANVHTSLFPGGEIRGQIDADDEEDDDS